VKGKKPNYGEAARELDEILEHIEEGEVDIDDLADKMQRAAELIELCRAKLHATEVAVKKIADELNGAAPAQGSRVRGVAASDGDDEGDASGDEESAPF
jgi:exodeoxyribonuclease VII small subunit